MTDPDPDRLPSTLALLRRGIDDGHHLGAQLVAWHGDDRVADLAVGQARVGTPMSRDTLTLWMSMGKPLTAVLAALLVDQTRLDLDAPVAAYLPEFAQNGKQDVRVEHLLTHTAGFRQVSGNWSTAPWDEVLAEICQASLEDGWIPGETAGYHLASSWYVLAEVCRRADGTGEPFETLLRRQILLPLGMDDTWVGMPRHRYVDYGTRIGFAYDTARPEAKPLHFPNSEAGCTLSRPGGNARGPVSQLADLYRRLLADRGDLTLEGKPLLSRDTARLFTTRRRVGSHDKTFNAVIDWGLGFLFAPADDARPRRVPYGYGPYASPDAFGHSGNQSSCAFADPAHPLVVCWATNGLPGELAHQRRQRDLNAAVYEDLGLA